MKPGPYKFTPATIPEPNRLIRCRCEDWSPYYCEGVFFPYSPKNRNPKQRGRSRFFLKDGSVFISSSSTWKDVLTWEYVEETA